jgi:hypothetical protein
MIVLPDFIAKIKNGFLHLVDRLNESVCTLGSFILLVQTVQLQPDGVYNLVKSVCYIEKKS